MASKRLLADDYTIRQALRAELSSAHDGKDAVIVEELKVSRGTSRLDLAVINGLIEGFEIKSDKDTLYRLPGQVKTFSLIADKMTLVVGNKHLDEAKAIIPNWWSIIKADIAAHNRIRFKVIRRGKRNAATDKRSLLELLDKSELLSLLAVHSIDKGVRKAIYQELANFAAMHLDHGQISAFVKQLLTIRAKMGSRFLDNSFGRKAIICSEPFESNVG